MILQGDFARLAPQEWLNDEIINGYLALLDNASPDPIIFASTFFVLKLFREGYQSVNRWHKFVSTTLTLNAYITIDRE